MKILTYNGITTGRPNLKEGKIEKTEPITNENQIQYQTTIKNCKTTIEVLINKPDFMQFLRDTNLQIPGKARGAEVYFNMNSGNFYANKQGIKSAPTFSANEDHITSDFREKTLSAIRYTELAKSNKSAAVRYVKWKFY